MLKINHLTITTHKGRVLLKDFSFVLNQGDRIALIGEEGNGKSTILKAIAGIDLSAYANVTGDIFCDGRIAYLPQSIQKDLLELYVPYYIDEEPDYNRLYTLCARIGIDTDLLSMRQMKTLSGGEKVRIGLLKILYEDPDVLLLDEPSNDLDLQTLIWLEEFLKGTDLPVIFVSHDETLLENCADGILHLEQLKRKSEAHLNFQRVSYREYLDRRDAYISRNNMIASKEKAQYRKQLERWRKIYQTVDHQQRTITRQDPHGGQLLKKKMHAVKAQQKNLERKKEELRQTYEPEEAIDIFFDEIRIDPNKVILDLDLPVLKAGEKTVGKDLCLKVLGKDRVCIIGENGAGKTTLIRKIRESLAERSDIKVGYLPQDYGESLDPKKTPVDFLMKEGKAEERTRVRSCLGALRFTSEEMEHRIEELSEGQKCKILLLKLILDKCDVLLMDEPTRNLSPLSNPRVREILNDFGGAIIAVSHDRKFIEEVANRIYELKDGYLVLLD